MFTDISYTYHQQVLQNIIFALLLNFTASTIINLRDNLYYIT